MSKYVDLILTEDGTVLMAPRWSYIHAGDMVSNEGCRRVVKDSITVNTEMEEYRFICEMEPNIQRIDAAWTEKPVKWEDENGPAE